MASLLEPESPSPSIYIPEEWSEAADSIAYDSVTSPPPIALICGAKNSGKTTFSRYLLNVLLQRSMLSLSQLVFEVVVGFIFFFSVNCYMCFFEYVWILFKRTYISLLLSNRTIFFFFLNFLVECSPFTT
jgi:hypothetical protein